MYVLQYVSSTTVMLILVEHKIFQDPKTQLLIFNFCWWHFTIYEFDFHSHFNCMQQENMSVECVPPHTPLLYSKTGVPRGIPIFLVFAPNLDCEYLLEYTKSMI